MLISIDVQGVEQSTSNIMYFKLAQVRLKGQSQ